MNKAQIIERVAKKTGISKITVKKSVDAFIQIAEEALRNGEKVTITDFGSFVVAKQPARIGRNFKTGAQIEIPPKAVVKFRPSIDPLSPLKT